MSTPDPELVAALEAMVGFVERVTDRTRVLFDHAVSGRQLSAAARREVEQQIMADAKRLRQFIAAVQEFRSQVRVH